MICAARQAARAAAPQPRVPQGRPPPPPPPPATAPPTPQPPPVAAAAAAIKGARALSMRINAWEWRWPLNTYRERDAKKLSQALLDRLAEAERMSLDQYREDLAERDKVRASYAELAPDCDACIGLSAPAAAPSGLGSTGEPNCTVHTSLLGIPAISLPVLQDEGLPLGLQIAGFVNGD